MFRPPMGEDNPLIRATFHHRVRVWEHTTSNLTRVTETVASTGAHVPLHSSCPISGIEMARFIGSI
jgi:hypothetical protein